MGVGPCLHLVEGSGNGACAVSGTMRASPRKLYRVWGTTRPLCAGRFGRIGGITAHNVRLAAGVFIDDCAVGTNSARGPVAKRERLLRKRRSTSASLKSVNSESGHFSTLLKNASDSGSNPTVGARARVVVLRNFGSFAAAPGADRNSFSWHDWCIRALRNLPRGSEGPNPSSSTSSTNDDASETSAKG